MPGQIQQSLVGHDRGCGISGLVVGHLGLWSSCFDCKIRLWNKQGRGAKNFYLSKYFQPLLSGDCLCILIGHTNPVRCIDVDRSRLVSGDYRGFVMIWDMEDIEQEMWSFKQKQKSNPPKLSTDGIYRMQGRRVVHTGSDTCEVLQHNSLLEHHGNVTGVFLTGPDVLVSASRDRTVNIHRFDHLSRPSSSKYERKSYL